MSEQPAANWLGCLGGNPESGGWATQDGSKGARQCTGSLNLLHCTLVDFNKSCTFCTFTVRGFIYRIHAEKPSWLKWEKGAPGAVGNPEQEGGASQDVEGFWIFHTQVYQRLNLINYSLQTAKSTWAYNVLMYLVGWKLLCILIFSVKKKIVSNCKLKTEKIMSFTGCCRCTTIRPIQLGAVNFYCQWRHGFKKHLPNMQLGFKFHLWHDDVDIITSLHTVQ